jgi:hypothetical protein
LGVFEKVIGGSGSKRQRIVNVDNVKNWSSRRVNNLKIVGGGLDVSIENKLEKVARMSRCCSGYIEPKVEQDLKHVGAGLFNNVGILEVKSQRGDRRGKLDLGQSQ